MEVPHEAAVPDNDPPTVQPPAQWAIATAATRERQPRWLDWPEQPTLRAESRAEFGFAGCHGRLASDGPNFLKGCKWWVFRDVLDRPIERPGAVTPPATL